MNNRELLFKVIPAAKLAGDYLRRRREQIAGRASLKEEANVAFESLCLITKELQKIVPYPIFSIERKEKLAGDSCWIIDPTDGTWNYLHNDVLWGVSIALVRNMQTQLGVIYLPDRFRLIGATTGTSIVVKCIREKINLTTRTDRAFSRAVIWMDWAKPEKDKEGILTCSVFAKIRKTGVMTQCRQCTTASLVEVAIGNISACVLPGPNPQDIAAGCLFVEKAGGKVTDFFGNPWTPFSPNIVASNGLLHDQILEALK